MVCFTVLEKVVTNWKRLAASIPATLVYILFSWLRKWFYENNTQHTTQEASALGLRLQQPDLCTDGTS